jgi:hypothetical protein
VAFAATDTELTRVVDHGVHPQLTVSTRNIGPCLSYSFRQ